MTAQLSRERLEYYANNEPPFGYTGSDIQTMARMLLAGMDSEPVAWRWNYGGTTIWRLLDTKPMPGTNPNWPRIIEPLYAAPPAPLRESLQHQASGNRPAVWVRIGDNNHAPDCTLDHDEAREWESRGLEVLRMVAPAPVAVPDKWPEKLTWSHHDDMTQAEVLAWNNAIDACHAAMLQGGKS